MSVSGLSLSGTVIPAGVDHRLILSFAAIEGALVVAHCLVHSILVSPMTTVIITEKVGKRVCRKIRTLIQTYAIVLLFAHWNACILRVIYEGSSGRVPRGYRSAVRL